MTDVASTLPPPTDSTTDAHAEMLRDLEIDPAKLAQTAAAVHEDESVADFLSEIRSINLGCCTLRPNHLFIIWVLIFAMPAIFGIASIVVEVAPPARVFYDSCKNDTGGSIGAGASSLLSDAQRAEYESRTIYEFPYATCAACHGGPTVLTNSSAISFQTQVGVLAGVIAVNMLVTLIATAAFVRLSMKEFHAIALCSYGLMIVSTIGCKNAVFIFLVFLLCIVASAVNVGYAMGLTASLDLLPLGVKDNVTADFGRCVDGSNLTHLYAVFHADNPSIQSTVRPQDGLSVLKAVLSSFLLYVPLVLKLIVLVGKLFNSFTVQDLTSYSSLATKMFSSLKYKATAVDVQRAVSDIAQHQPHEPCTVGGFFLRLISFSWSCRHPPSIAWNYSWGFEASDVALVIELLRSRGELERYTEDVLENERQKIATKMAKRGAQKKRKGPASAAAAMQQQQQHSAEQQQHQEMVQIPPSTPEQHQHQQQGGAAAAPAASSSLANPLVPGGGSQIPPQPRPRPPQLLYEPIADGDVDL